jgi:PAS domain S-box-containing protein
MQPAPSVDDEVPRTRAAEFRPEPGCEALVDAALALTGCPIGLLWWTDGSQPICLAFRGCDADALPPTQAFCELALRAPALLQFTDLQRAPQFADQALVVTGPRLRFAALLPLSVDGMRVGSLGVFDRQPRSLSAAQSQGLNALGSAAAELLRQRGLLLALQDQSMRLHDLARASGDWMWELDEQLRYRWISGEFERVTGLDAKGLLGQPIADEAPLALGHREAGPGLRALLERRQPFARAITRKLTPRGGLCVSRSAMPVFDSAGGFRGWRGTTRDVTAQVEAEQQAAQQHEWLRKLTSQVPGVIYQYRIDAQGRGRYLYASEGVRRLFGLAPPPTRHGSHPDALMRLLHPDDRIRYQEDMARGLRELRPWTGEYRVLRADGSLRWLESRAVSERLADGGTLVHGFSADITERKQVEMALRASEARWERGAEAAGIGLVEVDAMTHALQLDARGSRMHGLPAGPAVLPLQDWLHMLRSGQRGAARDGIEQAMVPRGHAEGRLRVRGADGVVRHVEFAVDARLDEHGRMCGLVGICRDVSEQVAGDRLRRDKAAAERANRAKSEFLSRVSHELRTPLNSILGFAELMAMDRQQPLLPAQQARLAGVQRGGRLLLDLIDEVLDLTRIEREQFALQLKPVDLDAVLDDVLRLVQPLADGRGIRLPAASTPAAGWVLADRRALEQVLMNLLSNAIKYNRAGGAVRLAMQRTGSDELSLAVIDEGQGLSPQQLAQLFQPFNRLGAERRRIEGSGLGLVIARRLMQAMNGHLDVHSAVGEGSRFSLRLQATTAPLPADLGPASAFAPLDDGTESRCVLYIEDEPLNVVLMEEVFRTRPGWTLHVADLGARGLALARTLQPDLVMVDMNLPDMDGLQVIRRLRADTRTAALRCVAFSADAMAEQMAAARAAGFDDYWTKPLELRRMLQWLGQAMKTD